MNNSVSPISQKHKQHKKHQDLNPEPPQAQGPVAAEDLLKHPNLWRAGQLTGSDAATAYPTGFAELDQHLPARGWPRAGLVELIQGNAGLGELRLFVPVMRALGEQQRWQAWVNPPFLPYAPALQALGVDISKILLIRTTRTEQAQQQQHAQKQHAQKQHKEALWALERATQSGTCSAVFAWLDEKRTQVKDTQRLQVAAKRGRSLLCLFRPEHPHPSMAELRLRLKHLQDGQLMLDIIKRRGGWPLSDVSIPLASATESQHRKRSDIQEQLSLWRSQQQPAATAHETADPGFIPPAKRPHQTPLVLH
ncbi:MAG: translesion DNA synthesis-associated protein ImuA [Pseudomonadota bacterium]